MISIYDYLLPNKDYSKCRFGCRPTMTTNAIFDEQITLISTLSHFVHRNNIYIFNSQQNRFLHPKTKRKTIQRLCGKKQRQRLYIKKNVYWLIWECHVTINNSFTCDSLFSSCIACAFFRLLFSVCVCVSVEIIKS